MPKQKTKKGLLKRIKITAKGKVKHRKAGSGHLLSNKPGKTLHKHKRKLTAHKTIAKKLERALGLRLIGREGDD
jgi:large subunit ribosomal protein L35